MHTYGDACEMKEMANFPLSGVGGGLKQWVRLLANFTKYTCASSTFIFFLMILTQGIGQTIYQQAVRLIEVGQ